MRANYRYENMPCIVFYILISHDIVFPQNWCYHFVSKIQNPDMPFRNFGSSLQSLVPTESVKLNANFLSAGAKAWWSSVLAQNLEFRSVHRKRHLIAPSSTWSLRALYPVSSFIESFFSDYQKQLFCNIPALKSESSSNFSPTISHDFAFVILGVLFLSYKRREFSNFLCYVSSSIAEGMLNNQWRDQSCSRMSTFEGTKIHSKSLDAGAALRLFFSFWTHWTLTDVMVHRIQNYYGQAIRK